MKLCLVYPPDAYSKSFILHETQSKHDGKLPPITLMTVAAAAEQSGHEALILDCNLTGLGPEDATRKAKEWGADALGFSLFTSNFAQNLDFIRKIRAASGVKVIAGGKHITYYPREVMTHDAVDFGVIGEGDATIGELLGAIQNNKPLDSVDGIAFRRDGDVIVTAPRAPVADLDALAFPSRHLVDASAYYSIVSPMRNFTLAMTSRGCPYNCAFCDVGRTPYRRRSVENILREMRLCREEFGVRFIDFQDSTFNTNAAYTKELCAAVAAADTGIKFMARARADNIDDELVRLLKSAGCFLILIGIESGDEEVLRKSNKDISLENIRDSVALLKKHGIDAMGYFVIGLPGDNKTTVRNTIRFSIGVGLDYAQFTKLLPMPNSIVYMELTKRLGKDIWKEYTLNPTTEFQAPMVDTGLSHEEAEMYLDKAYKNFYLRFSFIFRRLLRTRSPGEFARYARAALNLIFAGRRRS